MCTVTWRYHAKGYSLLCNHDEGRGRKAALPPALETFSGAQFLAPRDADRAGTWIAVNEYGISVCLLKGANPPAARLGMQSRGWLVIDLARFRSTAEMAAYLQYTSLYDYAGFAIAILAPRERVLVVEWDGYRARFERSPAAQGLLSSSSLDAEGARDFRAALFREYMTAGRPLAEYHASHGEGADRPSPCVHHAAAETVSFSEIDVSPEEATLSYSPGPPCRALPREVLQLPLVRWRS